MKKLLKYSMGAAAFMTLAGSVYAIPTLVVTDGSGISSVSTSASGVVTVSTGDTQWSVVVATGTASPPALGGGTPASPVMDLNITAFYVGNGTLGNPLTISFGSDAFGPTTANVLATLTGQVIFGTGNAVGFTTLDSSASHLPTTGQPVISGDTLTSTSVANVGGSYSSSQTGGPLSLSSYSLDEVITLTGNAGGSDYSIDAGLRTIPETVPDGGTTLMLLGSALCGLALIKRRLA